MKVAVKMIVHDLLADKKETLIDTIGLLNGDRLLYKESEKPRITHTVVFKDDQISIERKADIVSLTILKEEGSTARVTSEYGVMELPVEMIGRRKQNDEWMAEYKVLSGSEIVLHQKVIWQLVPLS